MKIKWRDALSVDNGPIDADHKYLIDLINRIHVLKDQPDRNDRFIKILDDLKTYTQAHFRREEALQKASGFPGYEPHRREHLDLERKLDLLIKVATGDLAKNEQLNQSELIFAQTQKFLREWLLDHVIGHDLQMKDYVDRMQNKAREMSAIDEEMIVLN